MARSLRPVVLPLLTVVLLVGMAGAAEKSAGLDQQGQPDLKSVGPLAFGAPDVLFVGDARGAALFAIGVEPSTEKASRPMKIEGIDGKLAALLGTKADDILINDLAVQPMTGVAYLSVSRGRGPDGEPVIAKVTPGGKISVLSLENVSYAKVALQNPPSEDAKDQRGRPLRPESITDVQFVDGRVIVAGLSSEEFASTLRAIAFPFTAGDLSTSIEIYHGAHGAFETRAPVRTFVPFMIEGEPHLIAAYTCTPLVTIPIAKMTPGSKLRGTTVAELGNMNRPLDIISYEKEGRKFLLLANDRRGVMKVATENIEKQEGITEPIKGGGTAGLSYETIKELKGVEQLDKLGDQHALLLVRADNKSLNLESVPLP